MNKVKLAAIVLLSCVTSSSALATNKNAFQNDASSSVKMEMLPVENSTVMEEIAAAAFPHEIDHTVTGGMITAEEMRLFEKRREDYFACPACATMQPYPVD